MSITLNGMTGITTPASTVGGSAVLTTASTIATSALPAGSVLQVVTGNSLTTVSTTSTSFQNTSATLAITPQFSNSHIIGYVTGFALKNDESTTEIQFRMVRGSTDLNGGNVGNFSMGNSVADALYIPMTVHFQDSPSTTNATTYTLQIRSGGAGTTTAIFYRKQYITLMEIAG